MSQLSRGSSRSKVLKGTVALFVAALWAVGATTGPGVTAYSYNSNTKVSPGQAFPAPGGEVRLTATVQSGCPPFEMCAALTGSLNWSDSGAGGSFSTVSCPFLLSQDLSIGTCVTMYTSPSSGGTVTVLASYSGNAEYSPSTGNSTVGSGSTETNSTSTSTGVPAGGLQIGGVIPLLVIGAGVVALIAFLLTRRRKSL